MTQDLVVIPSDPATLDTASDPIVMVLHLLEQTKALLAQASRIEDVVEWKARAGALAEYTRQRDLGKDAQLSAAEIVRRAERRIGELVREGQHRGEIRKQREGGGQPSAFRSIAMDQKAGTREFFGNHGERDQTYAMTDGVSAEQFEDALAEAKAEENLSRSNVARKARIKAGRAQPEPAVKGRNITAAEVNQIGTLADEAWTTRQIAKKLGRSEFVVRDHAKRNGIIVHADEVVGKTRRHDPNRLVAETVHAAEGAAFGLDLIDFAALDRTQIPGWVDSLTVSIRSLNQMLKTMKELTP